MRSESFPLRPMTLACLALLLVGSACGRKGDPIPRPRAEPRTSSAQWLGLRTVEVVLPRKDVQDRDLVGLEKLRVYYLPLGTARPTPQEVLSRGELILERRRPDLPSPGKTLTLDLKEISRPTGWIVITAVRVGDILGVPSEVLPWMDPALQ